MMNIICHAFRGRNIQYIKSRIFLLTAILFLTWPNSFKVKIIENRFPNGIPLKSPGLPKIRKTARNTGMPKNIPGYRFTEKQPGIPVYRKTARNTGIPGKNWKP